jgi:hypothetical protein
MPINRILKLLLAGMLLSPLGQSIAAQTPPTRLVPVTFLLKNDFSTPGLAAVVRQTGGPSSQNLIALNRASVSPEVIYLAVTSLGRSIKRFGDEPTRPSDIRISSAARRPALSTASRAEMQAFAQQLLTASAKDIPKVGRVPAFTVNVPIPQ